MVTTVVDREGESEKVVDSLTFRLCNKNGHQLNVCPLRVSYVIEIRSL